MRMRYKKERGIKGRAKRRQREKGKKGKKKKASCDTLSPLFYFNASQNQQEYTAVTLPLSELVKRFTFLMHHILIGTQNNH